MILFTLSNFSRVLGEEFIFEITDFRNHRKMEIYIKAITEETIRTDSQLKINIRQLLSI